MSHEAAREVICEGRGSHFDPRVVDAFLRRDQDFHRLQRALADPPTPVAALS
jgi:putative two-component system response regulator